MSLPLVPERDRYDLFVKGDSPLGNGRFWLVSMLKFQEGGVAEYRTYEAAVTPLLEQAGGKAIFRMYDHVATVVDGGGVVPDWDGIVIAEFASPSAFAAYVSSEAYRAAHKHRAAALQAMEMYACRAFWAGQGADEQGLKAQPNWDTDMSVPRRLADEKAKDDAAMKALNGSPEKVMAYFQDERFATGRVWQLNLLKYEGDGRDKYYAEYFARANAHIDGTMKKGSGGGIQVFSRGVFSLKGHEYDSLAIMQYPSREAFMGYALGSDRRGDAGMSDAFVLRTAGLAVQGLVSLGPEADAQAVRDPKGPVVRPASKL